MYFYLCFKIFDKKLLHFLVLSRFKLVNILHFYRKIHKGRYFQFYFILICFKGESCHKKKILKSTQIHQQTTQEYTQMFNLKIATITVNFSNRTPPVGRQTILNYSSTVSLVMAIPITWKMVLNNLKRLIILT